MFVSTLKAFLDTHIKNAFGGIDRSFIEAASFKALVIRRNGCGNMQLSHALCRQGSTVNKPACIFEPFSLIDVVFCCSIRSFYELTFIYYGFFIDGLPFFFLFLVGVDHVRMFIWMVSFTERLESESLEKWIFYILNIEQHLLLNNITLKINIVVRDKNKYEEIGRVKIVLR